MPPPALSPADEAVRGTLMVVDDYERAGKAAKEGTGKVADPGGVAQYFAGKAIAAQFQGGGGIDQPVGCGASTGKTVVDGAVVGTPVQSSAVPASISLPVSLYIGTTQTARVTVTADPASGKLTGFSCGAVTAPTMPGVQTLVGFYGGFVESGAGDVASPAIVQLKQQFLAPAFASWKWAGIHVEPETCAADLPTYWHAAYAATATAAGAQWYFWPGNTGSPINMAVDVDASANRIAWVYCVGQLLPQEPPAPYSGDQIQRYIGDLFTSYAYLLALQPLGADPSGFATYFISLGAYKTSVDSSGIEPLECSSVLAGSIGADSVTVTGTTAVVSMTSAPTDHTVSAGEAPLGHPKVTLDMSTMKILSVSCA